MWLVERLEETSREEPGRGGSNAVAGAQVPDEAFVAWPAGMGAWDVTASGILRRNWIIIAGNMHEEAVAGPAAGHVA